MGLFKVKVKEQKTTDQGKFFVVEDNAQISQDMLVSLSFINPGKSFLTSANQNL